MQKFINDPDNFVDESIEGFVKCHKDIIERTSNSRVLKYKNAPFNNKVAVVTGGGSGHLPAFIGYIGKNMVDSVAIGEIFSSPTSKAFYDAFKCVNSGKGVACLIGNFAGDKMNVNLATKLAAKDGIEVRTVIANDDVPSASKDQKEKRRGGAGEIFMWKIGGGMASKGASLNEVIRVSQKAIDNTRSMGVGLFPCTIPSVGKPNFTIEDGKMEIGIGHHGEKGLEVIELKRSNEIANIMLKTLLPDLPFTRNSEIALLLSGLGATPIEELYILFNDITKRLKDENINVYKSYVGNYFTSLDMGGATLTMMKLDDELKELLDLEVETMGLKQISWDNKDGL